MLLAAMPEIMVQIVTPDLERIVSPALFKNPPNRCLTLDLYLCPDNNTRAIARV
jgi:hypothetical protein